MVSIEERNIGTSKSTPNSFQAGRLRVIDTGDGWLLVSVHDGPDTSAELLPPRNAKDFTQWIMNHSN